MHHVHVSRCGPSLYQTTACLTLSQDLSLESHRPHKIMVDVGILLIFAFAVINLLACLVIYLLSMNRARAHEFGNTIKTSEKIMYEAPLALRRNMCTQYPVNYTWWRAAPRFLPISDTEHGAWVV